MRDLRNDLPPSRVSRLAEHFICEADKSGLNVREAAQAAALFAKLMQIRVEVFNA